MTVLVTGGAGFIGSNLVRSLLEDGKTVRVLDDLSTGRVENLAGVLGDVELIEADVRDPAAVAKAVTSVEVVHHLAALPSVARSVADAVASHQVNVDGTLNLMLAARPGEVTGDGRQTRDFTFVANAVHACRAAADAGPDAVGETMNIGCGDRISVLDLVGLINDLLATPIDPVFTPARPGDVRDSQASIAEAERLIGYRPLVGVREGVAVTVRWFADSVSTEGASAP
jgi:nucleoside-diphosphate-sugar epimerase